nr:fimbrial protein [Clostridium indicum]
MKKKMIPKSPQQSEPKTRLHPHIPIARIAYTAFLCVMLSMMFCQPAFAATDVWSKAKEVMQDVYNQILLISTVAAIVTASVALLMMNFSRSGRTVDESRAWLKRICITWAILNSLGFIMAYIAPFFSDGKWAG